MALTLDWLATSLLSEALATAQVTGHFFMSSLSCSETLPFALALSIAAQKESLTKSKISSSAGASCSSESSKRSLSTPMNSATFSRCCIRTLKS